MRMCRFAELKRVFESLGGAKRSRYASSLQARQRVAFSDRQRDALQTVSDLCAAFIQWCNEVKLSNRSN